MGKEGTPKNADRRSIMIRCSSASAGLKTCRGEMM